MNLNSVIRGWANYHRHVASKRTFSRLDYAIVSVRLGKYLSRKKNLLLLRWRLLSKTGLLKVQGDDGFVSTGASNTGPLGPSGQAARRSGARRTVFIHA